MWGGVIFGMDIIFYGYTVLFFSSIFFFFFLAYNFFVLLVYLELMYMSTATCMLLAANFIDDLYLEFFAVTIVTVAGAETAVAVSLFVLINRLGRISVLAFSQLKG